jgi:hypothetical protein
MIERSIPMFLSFSLLLAGCLQGSGSKAGTGGAAGAAGGSGASGGGTGGGTAGTGGSPGSGGSGGGGIDLMRACISTQATVLAEDPAYIDLSFGGTPIALDDNYVYWPGGDGMSILRVSKNGGGTPEVVANNVKPFHAPRAIAIANGNVYWIDLDAKGVMTVPVGGGTPQPFFVQPNVIGTELALYDGNLLTQGNGTIWMVPLDGGTAVSLGQLGAFSMALDQTTVFFSGLTDCIDSYPLAGPHSPDDYPTPVGPTASCQAGLGRVAVGATNVYAVVDDKPNLVSGQPGDIVSLPKAGGAVTPFATGLNVPNEIVMDGDELYVASAGGDDLDGLGWGSIQKIAVSGGQPVTLCPARHVRTIAVDQSSVYWVEDQGICKIAK